MTAIVYSYHRLIAKYASRGYAMQKILVTVLSCLALASCSQKTARNAQEQAADSGGPAATSVTAAPGVAFSYRYAFIMADTRIAQMQEAHAAACEQLGVARCRITGMQYTLVGENSIEGELKFKLDPALARQFGKGGITAVEKNDGKLIDAAIEGTDAGGEISDSTARTTALRNQLDEIEKKLAQLGLAASIRADLLTQAGELREQLRGEQTVRSESAEQLANTPMTFTYHGQSGFSLGNHPFLDAVQRAWSSLESMLSILLFLLAVLLPWLALGLLVMMAWRSNLGMRARTWLTGNARAAPDV